VSAPLAQAAFPTARAVRWTPVVVASVLLVGAALAVRASARPSDLLLALAAAALASMVVAALHDPARDLLAALPVSAMQRRVLRLALVGGPVLGAWTTLVVLAGTASDTTWTGSLLALSATGVAVAVWSGPRTGVALGAAVPVLWFALDRAVPGGLGSDAVGLWRTDPWLVAATAGLVCWLGRHR
jgi:hypothetical protein